MAERATTGRADYDQLVRFRSIPSGEPTFLLRGQDLLGAEAVRAYVQLAATAGAEPAFLQLAASQADAMANWPAKKLPDVDLDDHARKQLAYAWSRRNWNLGAQSAEALAEQRGFERGLAAASFPSAVQLAELIGEAILRCDRVADPFGPRATDSAVIGSFGWEAWLRAANAVLVTAAQARGESREAA